MGNILEALREAEKKNRRSRDMDRGLRVQLSPPPAENPRPATEQQMTGLFYTIESSLPGPGTKTVQFVGSELGDGASTVACVFAQTVAYRLNKVLLLMSSDLAIADSPWFLPTKNVRRLDNVLDLVKTSPNQDELFEGEGKNLYVSVFSGEKRLEGGVDQNPVPDLWDMLKERFDMILIDSPPIDLRPDGLVVARKVDGTILVVRAEKSRWPVIINTKERLERHGANILGSVLNDERDYLPEWLSRRLRA